MRSPSGSLAGLTAHSFIKRCLHMLRWTYWRNTTKGSTGGTSNHLQKEAPGGGFCYRAADSTNYAWGDPGFVPGSLSAQEGPWEIQCSENTAEETHIEILETLKECLWCRWGSTQLEEPRWGTPRTHAEVEYYTQMQVACDHFGSYQAWQHSPGRRP